MNIVPQLSLAAAVSQGKNAGFSNPVNALA